ncbi:MAG: hypothetical protein JNM52_08400 [Betaproteobacteria bacterium]|nr:hypothetical protein [Betaproteobacteria bacterium]
MDENDVQTLIAILHLAASGKSTKAMSKELNLPVDRIDKRLSRFYKRIGLPNRASAVTWFLQKGDAAVHELCRKADQTADCGAAMGPLSDHARRELAGQYQALTSVGDHQGAAKIADIIVSDLLKQ